MKEKHEMKKDKIKINEFYDNNWESERFINKDDLIRFNKIYGRLERCEAILDIGCLDGNLTKRMLDKAKMVVGTDISIVGLKRAKRNGIRCLLQDVESGLSFKDSSFDSIIVGEIIEHLLNTDYFLSEIGRVLKKDGRLYITTPNFASFGRRILCVLGENPFFEASFSYPQNSSGHVRFFNKGLLFNFLEYHGFKVTYYASDVIVLNRSGLLQSAKLADWFPTFGRSIIVEAVPVKCD